jgi:hypothetical protein
MTEEVMIGLSLCAPQKDNVFFHRICTILPTRHGFGSVSFDSWCEGNRQEKWYRLAQDEQTL